MPRGRIGALDQRITLAHKVREKDGHGGWTVTWTDYATVWANLTPKSGREAMEGQAQEATGAYEVKMRTREDVVEGDRITWNGRHLNVRFVHNEGARDRYMLIDADLGASS